MTHYHVFWARAWFARHPGQSQMELWSFEALTWIVSALEARAHSPLQLVTDSEGAACVRDTGLDRLYDDISTELDSIPAAIDPALFWDAGKAWTLLKFPAPLVLLDYDAVLWRRPDPCADVVALHPEDRQWFFYADNRERFACLGFDGPEWDWSIDPVNIGVLLARRTPAVTEFAERSLEFMIRYSRELATAKPFEDQAIMFSGQRLLPMILARRGASLACITRLHESALVPARNPVCSHLWISKRLYRSCHEARISLVRHLRDHLLKHHPESRDLLADWGLDGEPEDVRDNTDFRELPANDLRRRNLLRISGLEGAAWIEDANFSARRPAHPGSLVLPGERIHAGHGTRLELRPADLVQPEPNTGQQA